MDGMASSRSSRKMEGDETGGREAGGKTRSERSMVVVVTGGWLWRREVAGIGGETRWGWWLFVS